jgi:hypothetical protein
MKLYEANYNDLMELNVEFKTIRKFLRRLDTNERSHYYYDININKYGYKIIDDKCLFDMNFIKNYYNVSRYGQIGIRGIRKFIISSSREKKLDEII